MKPEFNITLVPRHQSSTSVHLGNQPISLPSRASGHRQKSRGEERPGNPDTTGTSDEATDLMIWQDLIPAGLGKLDPASGRWLNFNQRLIELAGCPPDELLNTRITDLITTKAGPLPWSTIRSLLEKTAVAYQTMANLNSKNGRTHTIKLSVALAKRTMNQSPCAFVTIEDVTLIHAAETRLRESQKLEAAGRIAASVAHDFNNIFTASLIHLSLIRDHPGLDHRTLAELKELESEFNRATRLNRQLLNLSRPGTLWKEPLDLHQAVASISKLIVRLLGDRSELQVISTAELPLILADPCMVDQLILNLVLNARDAQPEGGKIKLSLGLITVPSGAENRARPGDYVCLSVADEGCGMDKAMLEQIFEPYFTTKTPDRGTGIGLSTVQKIVDTHDGWIDVKSQMGVGSTFSIYLPAMAAA